MLLSKSSPSREEPLLSDDVFRFLGPPKSRLRALKELLTMVIPPLRRPDGGFMIQVSKIAFAALICFGLILRPPILSPSTLGQEVPQPNSPRTADAKPKAHSVNLNWKASTSVVVGYNIYRAEKSEGPFRKLNASAVGKTNYKDTAVQAGHTYFYKVAAVDPKGRESATTDPMRAAVPSP